MSRLVALLASAAGLGGAALMWRQSEGVAAATASAVESGGTFAARLTGYWPYAAKTAAEKKMEGGIFDRKMPAKYKNDPTSRQYKAHLIHTLEQHQADPVLHPYVSVSGDDAIFPYGQRIEIDQWPGVVFRVVDTGGHFRGTNKVYRIMGREPLDIAVDSPSSKIRPLAMVRILKGDHFDRKGKELVASKFQGQNVAVGCELDYVGAC